MKKILILLTFLFLINCTSQLELGKYENKCYSTDAPSSILLLEKNNRFVLVYTTSAEKLTGTWEIKNDTLILNTQYQSTLKDEDSIQNNEKKYFILKGRKLLNPLNEECYLILKK